jgi:hypothetical protein
MKAGFYDELSDAARATINRLDETLARLNRAEIIRKQ